MCRGDTHLGCPVLILRHLGVGNGIASRDSGYSAMRVLTRFGIAALLSAVLIPAATLEKLSLDEMAQKSTAIVRGRVLSSYAEQRGSIIYTHYRVQVTENWKGAAASELDVVAPGGAVRGLRQTFSGAPVLAANSEYVLFLWTGANGLTRVMGLTQGLFTVIQGAKGETLAVRPASTEAMIDLSSGRLVRDEGMTLRIGELRQRVSASAAMEVRK